MGSVLQFGPRPKPISGEPVPLRIDSVARERAEGVISELAQRVGEVETYLAWLGGFVEEGTLGQALVGSMGISAGQVREQIPALREVIREIPDLDGAA